MRAMTPHREEEADMAIDPNTTAVVLIEYQNDLGAALLKGQRGR